MRKADNFVAIGTLRVVTRAACTPWYTIANTCFFTYYLNIGVKVTQNLAQYLLHNVTYVAQYHPHHVTYVTAKFEVAMSNGLGEDAFTRKNII